jgi:serine/threonine protein phosphatase PrpC
MSTTEPTSTRSPNTEPTVYAAHAQAIDVVSAGASSVGQKRPRNEDQFLIATLQRTFHVKSSSMGRQTGPLSPSEVQGTLLVVADGMGGQGGGDVASQIAVRSVVEQLCSSMSWFDTGRTQGMARDSLPGVRNGLWSAITHGERQVRRAAQHGKGARDMGTTLTIAYLHFPKLYLAHVGDSRCYLQRAGQLVRLTRDHTMAEKLREEHQEEVGPDSQWHHVLWNAVGGGDGTAARPDMAAHDLALGDSLLLCSDGLTKHVSEERMAELMAAIEDPAALTAQLVKEANLAGGSDNITVVVARCRAAAPSSTRPD